MKIATVAVLTLEEAKSRVVDYYASVLFNDRQLLREIVETGNLRLAVPNLSVSTPSEIADLFAEFDLGRGEERDAERVLVELRPGELRVVYGPATSISDSGSANTEAGFAFVPGFSETLDDLCRPNSGVCVGNVNG